jgi:hypothetical protein
MTLMGRETEVAQAMINKSQSDSSILGVFSSNLQLFYHNLTGNGSTNSPNPLQQQQQQLTESKASVTGQQMQPQLQTAALLTRQSSPVKRSSFLSSQVKAEVASNNNGTKKLDLENIDISKILNGEIDIETALHNLPAVSQLGSTTTIDVNDRINRYQTAISSTNVVSRQKMIV